ncbi:hypothetical protein ACC734_40065, partial [Rhizobium ruizarguesonis]
DGLLGGQPLWCRFWDCAGLSPDQVMRFSDLRLLLREKTDALRHLDYGLIQLTMSAYWSRNTGFAASATIWRTSKVET